ncbi:MAG: HAMP domain-containing histidine kinase [Cytophagales bacterium]|nr:HAMP domain-containing histidine kinase [Cytophagales bacterium]
MLANLNKEVLKQQDEISKQNEELEHKNRELMELNNEKNYIIGIVAHDLKSPLFQIKGLVNLFRLSTKNLTQEQQEFINLMIQSIERASSMISRILDVKALESKILDINLTKTNLTEVVSEVVNDYRIIAKEKEIEIETELFDECYCHIDTDYVSQIFENLISNAIKFSPSNRSIFVKIGQVQDKVRVSVRDEGPGISEEDYPRLFEKFQKLDARPTAGESSTGLGLSIVKKYVEAMNGRVFVESTPGEGSTFHVEFPKVGHKQMV